MAGPSFIMDPDATLDFHIDWTAWLVGDTLVTSTWALDPADGATIVDTTATTTMANILVTGLVASQVAATNHVTTQQGRVDDRTLILCLLER